MSEDTIARDEFYGTARADQVTEREPAPAPDATPATIAAVNVARIRELTQQLGSGDAGIGAQIRALLP